MVVIATLLLLGLTLPSGAISLAELPRGTVLDVANDPSGILGLTVYSCVDKNTIDPLVDVTNHFQSTTSVTVSLVDGTLGTLHVGGQSGDTVTFSLGAGATDTVDFETTVGGPWPKYLEFNVDATSSATTITATRSSQIENGCGSTPTPTPTATSIPGNENPVADFTMTPGSGNKMNVDASASSDSDGTIVTYEWYINNPSGSGTPDATGELAELNPVKNGDSITLIVTDDDGATDTLTKTA